MSRRIRLIQPATKPAPASVQVIPPVSPKVWREAMRLAHGDKSRLNVLSWGSIEVLPPNGRT